MTPDDTLSGMEWRSLRTHLSHDLIGNCLLNELDAVEIRLNSETWAMLPEDWPSEFFAAWAKAREMADRLLSKAPYSLSVEAKIQELHLTDPMYRGLHQKLESEWPARGEIMAKVTEGKKRMAEAEQAYQVLLQVHGDIDSGALRDTEQRMQYTQAVHGLWCAIDRLKSALSSMGQF